MTADDVLADRIKRAIFEDGRLSEQTIELTVTKGIATLRGTVPSYRRKLIAHEIVASFDGCRDVINEITVRPPGEMQDAEVANHVRSALDAHADITGEVIAVSVTNGTVTLQGNVASEFERLVAEDVALSAKGVRGVQNHLVVDLTGEIEDQALSHNIREALKYARGLRDADIQVAVTGNLAVLSGSVQHLWQKEAASAVARRFRIRTIRNDIRVTDS